MTRSSTNTKKKLLNEALERYTDKIYPSQRALKERLESGDKLIIYIGVDPTGPHLHLGHATNFILLKRFQDMGHRIIFLIGDFTARIGDPADKLATRKPLSEKEIKENLKTFKEQTAKLINFSGKNAARIKFNSAWLAKMTLEDVIRLSMNFTVQQMIERSMFKKRIAENKPIGLHEFLYPLMQGYDSVAMAVDAEVGGTDQMFNMLIGRELLKRLKNKEKFVITTPLLEHPKTGKKLMNKSEGGLINLDDEPKDMFGKVMALDDEAMFNVARLSTTMPQKKLDGLKKLKPRDAKLNIASEVVGLYHGNKEAEAARKEFLRVFSKKEAPEEMPKLRIPPSPRLRRASKNNESGIMDLLLMAGVKSKSEARRLIKQGGVKINDKNVKSPDEKPKLKDGDILKIGKRRFFRISR